MGRNPIFIHHDIDWVNRRKNQSLHKKQINCEDDDDYDDDDTREPIDFIQKLGIENSYLPPLDNILKYLTPKDLSSASCVNKNWNILIKQIPQANRRLQTYVHDIRQLRKSVGEVSYYLFFFFLFITFN